MATQAITCCPTVQLMLVACDASATAILERLRGADHLCVLPLLSADQNSDRRTEFSSAGGALLLHPSYDAEQALMAEGSEEPEPVYLFRLNDWTALTHSSLDLVAQLGSLLRDESIQVVRCCAACLAVLQPLPPWPFQGLHVSRGQSAIVRPRPQGKCHKQPEIVGVNSQVCSSHFCTERHDDNNQIWV